MEAGAWPFLVGGVICLVKSDNERDLNLLNSTAHRGASGCVGPLVRRSLGFPFGCGWNFTS